MFKNIYIIFLMQVLLTILSYMLILITSENNFFYKKINLNKKTVSILINLIFWGMMQLPVNILFLTKINLLLIFNIKLVNIIFLVIILNTIVLVIYYSYYPVFQMKKNQLISNSKKYNTIYFFIYILVIFYTYNYIMFLI